jgi:hypothetical protein
MRDDSPAHLILAALARVANLAGGIEPQTCVEIIKNTYDDPSYLPSGLLVDLAECRRFVLSREDNDGIVRYLAARCLQDENLTRGEVLGYLDHGKHAPERAVLWIEGNISDAQAEELAALIRNTGDPSYLRMIVKAVAKNGGSPDLALARLMRVFQRGEMHAEARFLIEDIDDAKKVELSDFSKWASYGLLDPTVGGPQS